jgi:hypothetical protein
MTNSIETKGYFFLPEKPDNELPGTLTFKPKEGIHLDLFGHFDTYKNTGSKEENILLGFTANGKKVTLLNCYETSRSMNVPGFAQSKFSAIYLFIGEHYHSPDKISFDSCSIEYADLNSWLDISGFDKPIYNEENREINIRYKQPEKLHFSLKESWQAEIDFSFFRPHDYFTPSSKATIEQRPNITIKPGGNVNFKDYNHIISVFTSFMALNYFTYPTITSIEFYETVIKVNEFDPGFNKIELYFTSGLDLEKYKDHTIDHEFLLQYKNYKPRFELFIQNWYTLYEKIEASIKILTECFMKRGNPMELHFIGLVQAIENMHRRISGEEITLNQRLIAIVEFLPTRVRQALLSNEIDFEKRITKNRNFYTHYSVRDINFRPASLSELYILSEKLKIILITYLLLELSFSKEEVDNIILRKGLYLFNHLIDYPSLKNE